MLPALHGGFTRVTNVFGHRLGSRLQGMLPYGDLRKSCGELTYHFERVIRRANIDDEQGELVGYFTRHFKHPDHIAAQLQLVVMDKGNERQ